MKQSEKIISALVLMAVGVLFLVLQDNFIGILMTVAGGSLLIFGCVDFFRRDVPQAIVKMVAGLLLIVCGWTVVEAVLYILAGILLVFGGLLLYDKIKRRVRGCKLWQTLLEYATPVICILIGVLLLFHQEGFVDVVFIVSGILILVEGGVTLLSAFQDD